MYIAILFHNGFQLLIDTTFIIPTLKTFTKLYFRHDYLFRFTLFIF